MKKVIFFFVAILFLSPVFSQDNKSIFESATNAYTKKHYSEAADNYLKIIKSGFESPEVYFNLGNAYYKQSDFPSAIYYFEKARKLDPSDENIQFNIKLANTKIIDKADEENSFFIARWWRGLYQLFTYDTWAISGIVLLSLSFVLLAFYLFTLSVKIKKMAFWAAVGVFFFTFMVFGFAQVQYSNSANQKFAIVFTPALTAKSSPDATSTDLFVLHEGSKVKVSDELGDWYEIKLNNGSVGWVKKTSLKII